MESFIERLVKRDSSLSQTIKEFYKNSASSNRLYLGMKTEDNYRTVKFFDDFEYFDRRELKDEKLVDLSWGVTVLHKNGLETVAEVLACVRKARKEGFNVIPVIDGNEFDPSQVRVLPAGRLHFPVGSYRKVS